MGLAEPTTTLTDYALAALAAVLALRLLRGASVPGRAAARLLAASFAATAAAALTGGTYHGFAPYLSGPAHEGLWSVTYSLIGLASTLLTASALFAVAGAGWRPVVLAASALRYAAYLVFLLPRRAFRFVVYDYALTLAVAAVATLLLARRGAGEAARWLGAAVVVSLLGALVQRSGFALHPHFNHNDLFHVVQMAGLVLFYRAGQALPPR